MDVVPSTVKFPKKFKNRHFRFQDRKALEHACVTLWLFLSI